MQILDLDLFLSNRQGIPSYNIRNFGRICDQNKNQFPGIFFSRLCQISMENLKFAYCAHFSSIVSFRCVVISDVAIVAICNLKITTHNYCPKHMPQMTRYENFSAPRCGPRSSSNSKRVWSPVVVAHLAGSSTASVPST
jgi:hypothetical protein